MRIRFAMVLSKAGDKSSVESRHKRTSVSKSNGGKLVSHTGRTELLALAGGTI